MSIGDIAPSAKIIDLMSSIRVLDNQLKDCVVLIDDLSIEEQKELSMIKHKMISISNDLLIIIKKHNKWARNW